MRVRGFHAPVAVEAVAGVDVEGGVAGVAAGGRGDALVGERAVDIAAREAEAAAPEVEAGIEAGLRHGALRGGEAARERESDDGDGLFVHEDSFRFGARRVALARVKRRQRSVKLFRERLTRA